jgi:hypothetical protein
MEWKLIVGFVKCVGDGKKEKENLENSPKGEFGSRYP